MNTVSVSELLSVLMADMEPEDILAVGITANFASQIDKIRVGMGLNEEEFAEHTGMTLELVERLENCDSDLTIAEMAKIACKLDRNLILRLEETETDIVSVECARVAKEERGKVDYFADYQNKEKTISSMEVKYDYRYQSLVAEG